MRSITMINENLKKLSGDSTDENKSELDVLNEKIDNINNYLDGILQRLSQQAKKRADKSDKADEKTADKQDDKNEGDDNGNAE